MPFKPTRLFMPETLEEAAKVLKENAGHVVIIAGSTTIYGTRYKGLLDHVDTIVDLSNAGLDYIKEENTGVVIGAYTTLSKIGESSVIASKLGLSAVIDAVRAVPGTQLRNMATIGGSVSSSLPYYDMPVALTALDAIIRIYGPNGRRESKLPDFMRAPLKPDLGLGEFVYEIFLPVRERSSSAHEKFAVNDFDYGLVTSSVRLDVSDSGIIEHARIVVGGGVPRITLVKEAEEMLNGQRLDEELVSRVSELARESVEVIEDYKASSEYRRHLVGVVVSRALRKAWGRLQS